MIAFRPTRDETGLVVAFLFAQRATCARRQAGCLLVDRDFRVLSAGYNGPHAGARHCVESPCAGASAPSGQGLDSCEAIHAEQNALMYCADVRRIHTCYTTCSPCVQCAKLLLGTPCERIVFVDPYPHAESEILWTKALRDWCRVEWTSVEYWIKKLTIK